MRNRVIAFLLTLGLISGCAIQQPISSNPETNEDGALTDTDSTAKAQEMATNEETVVQGSTQEKQSEQKETNTDIESMDSLLGDEEIVYYDKDLIPSVKDYQIKGDFSNVYVHDMFKYIVGIPSKYNNYSSNELGVAVRNALIKNCFAVEAIYESEEFFGIYEENRYRMFPNFITVDSLMHTYHLYFTYLMKKCEKDYISNELKKLSIAMLDASTRQYDALKGTDWEEAALRNIAFFYVGAYLQDNTVKFSVSDNSLLKTVDNEISKINDAGGITFCELTGRDEDYTQYKPRGYYTTNEDLEKYFRTMMWYGRIPFVLNEEEYVKSIVLMNLAIDEAGRNEWEAIYNITSFFTGTSDDPGYTEVMPLIKSVYGGVPSLKKLSEDDESYSVFMEQLDESPMPGINSIPVKEGDNNKIPSFRFMGQRFTIDAAIMQGLVYKSVKENENGGRRYLPDALDVPAVLGSSQAAKILEKQGALEFEGYSDKFADLKNLYADNNPSFWNASLYSVWLNTLRPLLETKGEGYPAFMQSEEWEKKALETFEGAYAEIKHDTVLFSKQTMAEQGGGDEDELPTPDDRGYVEPEPVIYSRFIFLTEKTKEGLAHYKMLSDDDAENLDRLSTMAQTLLSISEKELREEQLTDDDYEFIRCYGGYLEHFWDEAVKADELAEGARSEPSCPVIADIATDPNGSILEIGTGKVNSIYVVFPINGELHLGQGGVYSFYQFETDIDNRMTDDQWKEKLEKWHLDDDYRYVLNPDSPKQPQWTQSYRVYKDN